MTTNAYILKATGGEPLSVHIARQSANDVQGTDINAEYVSGLYMVNLVTSEEDAKQHDYFLLMHEDNDDIYIKQPSKMPINKFLSSVFDNNVFKGDIMLVRVDSESDALLPLTADAYHILRSYVFDAEARMFIPKS
jgi:hypothetical protein